MKTYLLFLFTLFLWQSTFAQLGKARVFSNSSKAAQLRLEETITKATKSQSYYWNSIGSSYVLGGTTSYTYDSKGNVLLKETRSAGSNEVQSKNTYAYDDKGNETFYESLSYNNGEVSFGSRYTREYDGLDIVKSLSESYVTKTKKWRASYGYKYLREKDSKGNIIKEITQEADTNGQFFNTQLVEYTYDAYDQISSGLANSWDGTSWTPFERFIDIVWFNSKKYQLTSYKTEKWNGTAWVGQYQYAGMLDGGLWVETTDTLIGSQYVHQSRRSEANEPILWKGEEFFNQKEEKYVNGNWLTTYQLSVSQLAVDTLLSRADYYGYDAEGNPLGGNRTTTKYDSKGKIVSNLSLTFGKDGVETNRSGSIYRYAYDGNGNLVSEERDYFNSLTKTYEKSSRTTYSDFASFEVTGIMDAKKKDISFTVFPNPSTTGIFYLQESAPFSVCDIQGQELLNKESDIVNISAFPKGVYCIQIKTPQGTCHKKLVRE